MSEEPPIITPEMLAYDRQQRENASVDLMLKRYDELKKQELCAGKNLHQPNNYGMNLTILEKFKEAGE